MKNNKLKYDLKESRELDLNLYHLYSSLLGLQMFTFSKDIEDRLNHLFEYVGNKIFKSNIHGCDIVELECILTTYYKRA